MPQQGILRTDVMADPSQPLDEHMKDKLFQMRVAVNTHRTCIGPFLQKLLVACDVCCILSPIFEAFGSKERSSFAPQPPGSQERLHGDCKRPGLSAMFVALLALGVL